MNKEQQFLSEIQFYSAYSRLKSDGQKETYQETVNRVLRNKNGLFELGDYTEEEKQLIQDKLSNKIAFGSARYLWIGGTEWLGRNNSNHFAPFNCISMEMDHPDVFGYSMNLGMQGCGVGQVVSLENIDKLPVVKNKINLTIIGTPGDKYKKDRYSNSIFSYDLDNHSYEIIVGDSRQGWVDAYQLVINIAYSNDLVIDLSIDLSHIRPYGERLNGFGGSANPGYISTMFTNVANILNNSVGRKLNSLEVILILEEAAKNTVSGNIRRVAGMKQGNPDDPYFTTAKDNLWIQDSNNNWSIDPTRDALRMSNHTTLYHTIPSLEVIKESITKQYYSGEGAIMYVPEALARANADLLDSRAKKNLFIDNYTRDKLDGLKYLYGLMRNKDSYVNPNELEHRLKRFGLNPCVTADTWVHTENGARQVKDLIGVQQSLYINGELFSTTEKGFFLTGVKPVVKIQTKEGLILRLTDNHQLLKVTAQTQKKQYTQWCETKDLQVGDKILIHNHRNLSKWEGKGTENEGWLLGNFIGDGCFSVNEKTNAYAATLRYWGDHQVEMKDHALNLVKESVTHSPQLKGTYNAEQKYFQVNSAGLAKLAKEYGVIHKHKTITPEIEQASYDFYCGFLRGLFDADGSVQGNHAKGISIRLTQPNLELLQSVQRMLLRLGINSSIYLDRHKEGFRKLPDSNRNLKDYYCKASHELMISNDNIPVYQEIIGFRKPDKAQSLNELISGYKRNFNRDRFTAEILSITLDGEEPVYDCTVPSVARFDANGFVAHNCAEVIGSNFRCNLGTVHLSQVGVSVIEQSEAFRASALQVVSLLKLDVDIERFKYSHSVDPIVLVSATQVNEWFINYFGTGWVNWWLEGRPNSERGLEYRQEEASILNFWRKTIQKTVQDYCVKHDLKVPNRYSGFKPEGSLSWLSGSPGFSGIHFPPSGSLIYTRRKTFLRDDPIALAAIDYGYKVIAGTDCKDENGKLFDNPYDPRVKTWLLEIPVKETVLDRYSELINVNFNQISALAQFDWLLQLQQNYSTHNTSYTLSFRKNEIDDLSKAVHNAIVNNKGYVSMALLARPDESQTFPRMPFESITLDEYNKQIAEIQLRRKSDNFKELIKQKLQTYQDLTSGEVACSSEICEIR
jgi:ribonucleotide reductase class II